MKSTIRRSQRDYSLAFKLSVVDQVERGGAAPQKGPGALWDPTAQHSAVLAPPARSARLVGGGIIAAASYLNGSEHHCTLTGAPRPITGPAPPVSEGARRIRQAILTHQSCQRDAVLNSNLLEQACFVRVDSLCA